MPQFSPGQAKTARAPITVKPAGLACSSELYLVSNGAKVATSGIKAFTSTGTKQDISFLLTMPSTEGTYPVYLDIFIEDMLIGAYKAVEDVVVIAPHYLLAQTCIEDETGFPVTITPDTKIYAREQVKLWQYLHNVSGAALPPWSIATSITYPDGTKHKLSEVRRSVSADGEWAYVVFLPFSVTQVGTYVVEAKLEVGGQVVDELSLELIGSIKPGWNNPIGYNDPDGAWYSEVVAMDGEYQRAYDPFYVWPHASSRQFDIFEGCPYLEFSFLPMRSSKLRFCPVTYFNRPEVDSPYGWFEGDIDIYYEGSWHTVFSEHIDYTQVDIGKEYNVWAADIAFPEQIVSGVRFKWKPDPAKWYTSDTPQTRWAVAYLYAVQLWNEG